jgi:hypothetical protein
VIPFIEHSGKGKTSGIKTRPMVLKDEKGEEVRL